MLAALGKFVKRHIKQNFMCIPCCILVLNFDFLLPNNIFILFICYVLTTEFT